VKLIAKPLLNQTNLHIGVFIASLFYKVVLITTAAGPTRPCLAHVYLTFPCIQGAQTTRTKEYPNILRRIFRHRVYAVS